MTATTLGQYLSLVRKERHMTLRDVEAATKKEVSNAYLSQIENDKIQRPDPNILHALAEVYQVRYEELMELAGYITPVKKGRGVDQRHGRVPTFAKLNLSADEEAQLLQYLKFLRSTKK